LELWKTRRGGAIVLAAAVLFGVWFGSRRSLNSLRGDAVSLFEQGADADGVGVKSDLERRRSVCINLYTVASRYLDPEEAAMQYLDGAIHMTDPAGDRHGDLFPASVYVQLDEKAEGLLDVLAGEQVSEKDDQYLTGFAAELESIRGTIRHDPYTAAAREFNEEVLTAFPASLLRVLTGVERLPVYQ